MPKKFLFWLIILLNLGGAVYGFAIYYRTQFLVTNPLLWIFIPDCPLFALLFAVGFATRAKGKNLQWVWFLTIAGALKYGFWTMFVLLAFSPFYFGSDPMTYSVLFVGHLILFFESVLLVGKVRLKEWHILPTLGYFLVNDLSDYLLNTHPPITTESVGFMFYATVAMSLVFTGLAFYFIKRFESFRTRKS